MSSRVIVKHVCFTFLEFCLLIQCMNTFLKSLERYIVTLNTLSVEFNGGVKRLPRKRKVGCLYPSCDRPQS